MRRSGAARAARARASCAARAARALCTGANWQYSAHPLRATMSLSHPVGTTTTEANWRANSFFSALAAVRPMLSPVAVCQAGTTRGRTNAGVRHSAEQSFDAFIGSPPAFFTCLWCCPGSPELLPRKSRVKHIARRP